MTGRILSDLRKAIGWLQTMVGKYSGAPGLSCPCGPVIEQGICSENPLHYPRQQETMYREGIKLLDCTVRDGGLMNQWQFSDESVRAVYQACMEAGIDYMEIGYVSSESAFSRDKVGPWRFCREEDLRRIVGKNDSSMKLSAMADIGRVESGDILPASASVLDMIRVACYVHQVEEAIILAEDCLEKGYECSINLMAVSSVKEADLDTALVNIGRSRVPVLYAVDSFGNMTGHRIGNLVKKYREALPGRTIGIHAHNNMQMAVSNTVTGLEEGCNMLDATLMGMGRAAGNCPMEILVSLLDHPKYRLLPLLAVIQEHILPRQKEMAWGYHVPYLITGSLNEHPRRAMQWIASGKENDLVSFLKEMEDNK
jgi:4-hydroxy 2-oxovalerate aldolase